MLRNLFKRKEKLTPPYAAYINAAEIHALYERTNARLEWMISRRAKVHSVTRGDKVLYLVMDEGGALSTFRATPYDAIDEASRIFPTILEDEPKCLTTSAPSMGV